MRAPCPTSPEDCKSFSPVRAMVTQWDRSHLQTASYRPSPVERLTGEITEGEKLWEAARTVFSKAFLRGIWERLNRGTQGTAETEGCSLPPADLCLPRGKKRLVFRGLCLFVCFHVIVLFCLGRGACLFVCFFCLCLLETRTD